MGYGVVQAGYQGTVTVRHNWRDRQWLTPATEWAKTLSRYSPRSGSGGQLSTTTPGSSVQSAVRRAGGVGSDTEGSGAVGAGGVVANAAGSASINQLNADWEAPNAPVNPRVTIDDFELPLRHTELMPPGWSVAEAGGKHWNVTAPNGHTVRVTTDPESYRNADGRLQWWAGPRQIPTPNRDGMHSSLPRSSHLEARPLATE